jgi:hypothetical protein
MQTTETLDLTSNEERLPMRLSQELWASMSSVQQSVYRRAEALVQFLEPIRQASIGQLITTGPGGEVLRALEVLEGMDLVNIEPGDSGPTVHLIAVPNDHVSIVGPDGQKRWIFIAQPLDPPELDPKRVN